MANEEQRMNYPYCPKCKTICMYEYYEMPCPSCGIESWEMKVFKLSCDCNVGFVVPGLISETMRPRKDFNDVFEEIGKQFRKAVREKF